MACQYWYCYMVRTMRPLVPFLDHLPDERLRMHESTAAWEADRAARRAAGKGEIGGSVVAQILGLRPFGQTPWAAWLTLTGQRPRRDEATQELLNEGLRLEPLVAQEYARVAEPAHVWRAQEGVLQVVGKEPWVVVSPDGFTTGAIRGGPDSDLMVPRWGGLELKTDRVDGGRGWAQQTQVIDGWTEEAGSIIPAHYACQGILSMYACELPFWDFAAWVPRPYGFPELRWHRLMRAESIEQELIDKLGAWREKHLIQGEPPDLDDSVECRGFLTKLHPGPKGDQKPMRPATPKEEAAIHEWIYAKSRVAEAEQEESRLRNEILSAIGDNYGLTVKRGKVIAFTNHGRRTVDMARLEREHPDLFQTLTKEGAPYRTVKPYVR